MREDPKLIGYFYTDCPMWVHTARENEWNRARRSGLRDHQDSPAQSVIDGIREQNRRILAWARNMDIEDATSS
jgi:hypothetical protein